MASTKEMQARAKQRKTAQSVKFPNPGIAHINKGAMEWFNNLQAMMAVHSPWKSGYTMPDSAIPYLRGIIQQERDRQTKEVCQDLLKSLYEYRDFAEKSISYKLQMDADDIREKSTPNIMYKLGMLDAVIGFAMTEFGNVKIHHIDMNQFV
jgi:hypothetical protein